MGSVTPCPSCGMPSSSAEIRCPRCNALKLKGCTGSCGSCAIKTPACSPKSDDEKRGEGDRASETAEGPER